MYLYIGSLTCFIRRSATAESYAISALSRSYFWRHRWAMCTCAVSQSGSTYTKEVGTI